MSSVAEAAASSEVPDNADGAYLSPGDYLLQATGHKEHDEKKAFIAEHDVLWSKPPAAAHPDDAATLSPGASGTFYVDCGKFKGQLAWQVKAYLSALTKTPVEDINKDGIVAVLTTDQPYVGAIVRCKAWPHVTKNKVRITKYRFTEATPEDAAQVAKLRKDAGLPPLEVVE